MYRGTAVAGLLIIALSLLAGNAQVTEMLHRVLRPTAAETSDAPLKRGAAPAEKERDATGERREPGAPGGGEKAVRDRDLRPAGDADGDRVGDFCYPDEVPYHGVSSAEEAGNDLIKVLELVVRTRDTSATGLTLITRSFKAFYEDYDALVISFYSLSAPDKPAVGEAIVTSTDAGAFILGMSGGPANKEGMTVVSYADPAPSPQAEVFADTECS